MVGKIEVEYHIVRIGPEVSALHGVEDVATAAVCVGPVRGVSKRHEDPSAVGVEPEHI